MPLKQFLSTPLLVLFLWSYAGVANAAELLVVEQPNCPYCDRFHAEIAPAYPNTVEGRRAPLRIVQLGDPIENIKPATVTPTFILVDNNQEVDRLVGYPGDDYFWFLIGEMLQKLPQ
ncbi:MAG: thioredoxin family protein [Gammaproteobacteria bacterium]|nr:thioredoxin family protein [Gammaproteobacteria bacterium]